MRFKCVDSLLLFEFGVDAWTYTIEMELELTMSDVYIIYKFVCVCISNGKFQRDVVVIAFFTYGYNLTYGDRIDRIGS